MRTYSTEEILRGLQRDSQKNIQEAIEGHNTKRRQWALFVPFVSSVFRAAISGCVVVLPIGLALGLICLDEVRIIYVARVVGVLLTVVLTLLIVSSITAALANLHDYCLISRDRIAVFAVGGVVGFILPVAVLTLLGYVSWGG